MESYYYYKVFRKTIIMFLELFSNIKIGRYNSEGVLQKNIVVPVRFSPKTKAYTYIMEAGRNEEMLPMLSVDLQSIDFDSSRMGNRHESIQVTKDVDTHIRQSYKNAVPYNLTFNLRIWALHMVDVDQIYEQILPYFAPYVFMRIYIPEVDTSVEVKVVLQSCSPEMTDDVTKEEARIIRWSTTFVCQTWLFKPITDVGIIEKIYMNYYLNEDEWDDRSTTSTFTSGASGAGKSDSLVALGYDDDARILYEYEEWMAND